MAGVLTSAKRAYHDNFLQYEITGDPRYKKAYEAAQQTMDTVISNLEKQISPSDTAHKLRSAIQESKELQRDIIGEQDRLKEATMRGTPLNQIPIPSMTTSYIMTAVVAGFALVLVSM